MGDATHPGAYGFRFSGVDPARRWLNPTARSRPIVAVTTEIGTEDEFPMRLDDAHSDLALLDNGGLHLTRRPARARFVFPRPIEPAALVHPHLAPAASVHAHWQGWQPFHAGGIVVADRVWAIIGTRATGKSTLVAGCARAGLGVVTDDLLVVEDLNVHPGPRSVDLRPDAARHLGVPRNVAEDGTRPRFRMTLDAAPAVLPLAGWVVPNWGPAIDLQVLSPAVRVPLIEAARTVRHVAYPMQGLLRAAGRPAFAFTRPRDWSIFDQGIAELVEVLANATATQNRDGQ